MIGIRRRAGAALACSVAVVVAVGALIGAGPANAAGLVVPDPKVTFTAVSDGSAIENGLSVANQAGGIAIGSPIKASVGNVNYTLATAEGYKLRWFVCPAAGTAIAGCAPVASATGNGSASGKSVEYTPVAADRGKYLAAEFQIISSTLNNASTSTVTSDRSQDVKVVAGPATSARPTWSTGLATWKPGDQVSVVVDPWNLAPALTQTMRSLSVWACDSPNAGQVATLGFSLAGCTALSPAAILTNVNVRGVSVAKVQTSADMNGKYLLAMSNLVASSGGAAYAFVIRSEAKLLGTAATTSAQAAPSPSATPTPTASTTATTTDTAAPAQEAVTPVMTILAKRKVKRGSALAVALTLAGSGGGTLGTGRAKVELLKSPSSPKRTARLKVIRVHDGKGVGTEPITRSIKPGTYYMRVIFTDAGSGVQAGALKRIRVL